MFGLIMRDLIVQRKRLGLIGLMCLMQILVLRQMGEAALVIVVLLTAYVIPAYELMDDDKYQADTIMISLPITWAQLVIARYLEVPIYAACIMLVYMLATAIAQPLLGGMFPTGWRYPAAAFLAAALISGLHMPFVFRFGYLKIQVLNVGIILICILLPCSVMAWRYLEDSTWGLPRIFDTVPETTLSALMIAIAVLILAVSCMISIRVYRKRQF